MEFTRHPLSMTMAVKPAFCVSMAQAMPVGPAPTIRTSLDVSGRDWDCGRGRVSGICSTDKSVGCFIGLLGNGNSSTEELEHTVPGYLLLYANRHSIADGQDGCK